MWMGLCFSCIEWLYPISILSRFQPFLWFMCIFWCQTDRRLNFSLYFCAGLPSPCYKFVKVRRALSRWQNKAAHAVLSMAEPWNGKAVQGGHRVGGYDIIIRRSMTLCSWRSGTSQISCTVRTLQHRMSCGCVYTCIPYVYWCYTNIMFVCIIS